MIKYIQLLKNSLLGKIYSNITHFMHKYLFSALIFFMRYWMAKIFWYSGLTKISSWESTIYLFKYEYSVPLIPAELAAILATTTELTTPILLLLGFMSRIAAIPMLCMTIVIQFTYLDLVDHLYWAILLCTIIFYGPGRYSIDNIIKYVSSARAWHCWPKEIGSTAKKKYLIYDALNRTLFLLKIYSVFNNWNIFSLSSVVIYL